MTDEIRDLYSDIIESSDFSGSLDTYNNIMIKGSDGEMRGTVLLQDPMLFAMAMKVDGTVSWKFEKAKPVGSWLELTIAISGSTSFRIGSLEKAGELVAGEACIYAVDRYIHPYDSVMSDLECINILIANEYFSKCLTPCADFGIAEVWDKQKAEILLGNTWTKIDATEELKELASKLFHARIETTMDYLRLHRETLELIEKLLRTFAERELLWKRICRLNADRCEGEYSLKELSSILKISKYKINQSFYRHKGMSYAEYLRYSKLVSSCKRLEENNMSILEIALEAGFENPGKFSAMFKRYMGTTPSAYRKVIQK